MRAARWPRLVAGRPQLVWTSTGDAGPTDCAVGADGTIYVSRYGDHVDRINSDGSESIVAVARRLGAVTGVAVARGACTSPSPRVP